MPTIARLSQSLINKIAAGEVIERPASVIKELVENSVDAGSKRIDVSIAKGGVDSMRILDDGHGIEPAQLPLAVTSHATSKLTSADDLFSVASFGFRGEALASIAEVSHFRIRSRTADAEAGAELEIVGGNASEVMPCACPVGTSIEVRNLFFNTPVRRKFLKTTQTEMGHISEALTRIALPHEEIHFSLEHNDRVVYDLPRTDDWRQRIATLFGEELADRLIWVEAEEGDLRVHGFVADPAHNRGNSRMQYLFLNGRFIRDRALGHALTEAYRGLLMTGRYPITFLRLEMPTDQVDVNVHPTKMEVRFQESGKIYSHLLGTLRSRFLSSDLSPRERIEKPDANGPASSPAPTAGATGQDATYRERRQAITDWASQKSAGDARGAGTPVERQASFDLQFPVNESLPSSRFGLPSNTTPAIPPLPSAPTLEAVGPKPLEEPLDDSVTPVAVSVEGTPAMQVYDRYLITETPEGVVVIDQHALHERIIYEEIRGKVLDGQVEMQRLLVPEPVTLMPEEASALSDNRDELRKLGIELEKLSGTTVVISAYPAMLSNLDPAEILRNVAELVTQKENGAEKRDLLDELLHMISCKAAIKAGDRLTRDEISSLMERRQSVQDWHHCPHGRPTTLVFSRDELDRRFKRV
jgi:DNA mismatch repair protein MutL